MIEIADTIHFVVPSDMVDRSVKNICLVDRDILTIVKTLLRPIWKSRYQPMFRPDIKHNIPFWENNELDSIVDYILTVRPDLTGPEHHINNAVYLIATGCSDEFSTDWTLA